MKKILVVLVALFVMLATFTASAEAPMDVYSVIELARSAIASDSTDFVMDVNYSEEGDVVVFTTVMNTMDWEVIASSKSMPEFQTVITSLLETNIAMKGVFEACELPQNVIGMLVTSDGAIVAVYYNDVDVTSFISGN